jgi:hypothetical protein
MQPFPVIPSPAPPTQATTNRKRSRWLGPSIGVGAVIVVLGLVLLRAGPAANREGSFSDLPEWFDRARRIQCAEQVNSVEGIGMLRLPPVGPSSQFTQTWLEQKFTHYVADDAFVWATPENRYPTDGKILAGTKVISSGKQVNQFTLVCAVTKDGQAFNFFMHTLFLRERAKGPPEIRDDD